MLHCQYKAWKLSRNDDELLDHQSIPFDDDIQIRISENELTSNDKLIIAALYQEKAIKNSILQVLVLYGNGQTSVLKVKLNTVKAQKLFADTYNVINCDKPPSFFRNPHCPECPFQDECYRKLKEKDCISLLTGIPPKIILKFQKRGVYSIEQLSHLFRPRRRRRHPQASTNYLWELKAKAIREQKTFVLCPPPVKESPASIYIDFEGLPDEGWVYLIGIYLIRNDNPAHTLSLWADRKENEQEIFTQMLAFINDYPEAPIYHYGSYETKNLRSIQKKYPTLKNDIGKMEARMENLLSILRTHVYPPVYGNGLKELGQFLGYRWTEAQLDGKLSILWRKNWEGDNTAKIKDSLVQYNLDDCKALVRVKEWFDHLAKGIDQENIQQVADMKRQSLYKFQNNPELGTDFQFISKAAYFDYQRSKIYWRNKESLSRSVAIDTKPKSTKKGTPVWQPPKIHETLTLIPLTECPKCGASKVYHYHKKRRVVQTDLKFTPTGIKQHVTEYLGTRSRCAKCWTQYNDHILRRTQYGDNLFAYVTNLYISYNISNYLISNIMEEQFGIWISPMYLVMRKQKWWKQWEPEVNYLWEIIKHSPVMHIDETSINLENKSGYVWVFATVHTVLYHYTDTRDGSFLHEWLKDYKGVIVTDFFTSYESLPIARQKCLIHFIRDLNDDLFKNPFDDEYKVMVTGFNALLRKIIETIGKYGLTRQHLQKHVKDTDNFLHMLVNTPHKSELSNKYAKRFQKHWPQLWTFLYHDGIPWNNNNAETAVKAFAQYRRGVKGMIGETGLRDYLKMLSIAQTCRYRNIKFLSFLRHKSGIWENIHHSALPGYLPFAQARQYARKLKIKMRVGWMDWLKLNKCPSFIPRNPEKVYKDSGWIDWADWLGFSFWPFEKARIYMHRLGLKNSDEYKAWLKSKARPKTIPHEPARIYKHSGWNGLGDWLGTGTIANQRKKKLPYEQAKAYVQAIGIKTWLEYTNWSKNGQRPTDIPAAPDKAYREFEGWGKFLGTDRVANQNKEFWSYEVAKEYLTSLNIKSKNQFVTLCKNGAIPDKIPRDPAIHYKRKGCWGSYREFLGWSKQ